MPHDSGEKTKKFDSGIPQDAVTAAESLSGSVGDADELMRAVYDELRRLARHFIYKEGPGQTLTATALVHEAYVRLSRDEQLRWEDDRHFYLAAAQAMRRILVDRARAKGTLKRGGERQRIQLDNVQSEILEEFPDFVRLDDALSRLSLESERVAQVVMLRFFVGLSNEQAAKMLGVSTATTSRDWQYARAWLHDALQDYIS